MYKQRKRSKIWTIPKEDLQNMLYKHDTLIGTLKEIDVPNVASGYEILKKRIKADNLDISHIPLGYNNNLGRHYQVSRKPPVPDKEVFCENSRVCGATLKRRVIRRQIIEYKCQVCGNVGEWQGKKISLQLNHKNGISNDNRPENLEFLCPNCHSQTPTFSGRNREYK